MRWRKVRERWIGSTSYAIDDKVVHQGVVYQANTANINDRPPSSNWDVVATPVQSTGSKLTHYAWDLNWDEIITMVEADNASVDAFGRQRVAAPHTLFDSKQLYDNQPLFWDDQEISGSGTGSSHSTATAATVLSVGAAAGKRTRQTFRRFNYQPGKSQLVLTTFSDFDVGDGITKRVGYFDDNNGLFLENVGVLGSSGSTQTLQVVRRSKVTGSVVDTAVTQTNWNIDPMDGTGPSGVELDISTSQILLIDLEWLGVGRVRMGFVIDGAIYHVHEFLNANNLSTVYMSTPNLPVRYELENDGSGGADTLAAICCSVISEGGQEETGIDRSASTGNTHIDANAADTKYAVLGLRLKASYIGTTVLLKRFTMLAETNDDFEWSVMWNPTVAGTFAYADQPNSACQAAFGATANTVSGGTLLDSGYGNAASALALPLNNALILGSTISGTVDELVLCARPISSNADIQATLTWRELL
jgi:hypothetical protein